MAVAIGVVVLLGIFADFHAYQKTSNRPSWESTSAIQSTPSSYAGVELWNYSENIYNGEFIEQLDVAPLGANAPVPPGISKLPAAGQFYVSPALSSLLSTVPKDELGNRFPGKQIGLIGQSALSFPTELAIMIGYEPQQLEALPGTIAVNNIATSPQLMGTTNIYRDAFAIGAVAVLFPLLILINTATRLAAARREERYAAMRLIGATPRQVNVFASVDAVVSALIGTLLGIGIFSLLRHAIADISFSGVKFFYDEVTPTLWGYIGMVVIVPIAAAIASLLSLRRVQISPLGVSRKASRPKPGIWRLIPLIIGVPFFLVKALEIPSQTNTQQGPGLLIIGLLLIMIGLVTSGSWLTMQASRLMAILTRGASSLLAARRLSDNPKGAFRSISGLMLAVFVGSFIAVLVPAINAAQSPISSNSLTNVLRVPISLSPQDGASLIHKLDSFSGTNVIPLYVNPALLAAQSDSANVGVPPGGGKININGSGPGPVDDSVLSCASLKLLPVLGKCAPGETEVTANAQQTLSGDNPLFINKSLPLVNSNSQPISDNLGSLDLGGLLVKTSSSDTLEKVRTFLTTYTGSADDSIKGGANLSAWQMGDIEPETFGEVAQIRNNDDTNVGRVILAAVALTLITAGCSLTVTLGGSLIERKRPFTLLRVSGTPVSVLYKDVLLEAAVPLVVVSIFAAGVGLGVSIPVIRALLENLAPQAMSYAHPSLSYYLAVGIGLLISLLLIITTLPLLNRITQPAEARFE